MAQKPHKTAVNLVKQIKSGRLVAFLVVVLLLVLESVLWCFVYAVEKGIQFFTR